MANDDNLNAEFRVTGDGEATIQRISKKIQDLGANAAAASSKQVAGTRTVNTELREQLEIETQLAAAVAKVSRAAAQTKAASNRIVASNATTSATSSTAVPKATAQSEQAIYKALLAEQNAINAAQEQQNRNLLNAGKILTENERREGLIQSRVIATTREQERQSAQRMAASAREAKAAADAQTAAEKQGALYTKYLEDQQTGIARKKAAQEKASAQELRDVQRVAAAQQVADAAAIRRLTDRTGRERTAAIASERNAAAIAGGSTTERTSSVAASRAAGALDINQANSLRYALYDVAQTATIAGTAIAAIGGASVTAAAQAEQQFANLSATIGETTYNLGDLDDSLLKLTTSTPTDLAEVVGVARLGAQMNIAEGDLESFTQTITQFSATTNVSSEAAAESFGRISQLLNVPADQFKNLSSSIYQVGVDSVATESQILKTSEEIAGTAAAYDFTADSVVGLAGAFASLAIQPEQARGATTRIFNKIETAVQENGAALQNYGRIAGLTADEVQQLWSGPNADPSAFFEKLIKGLGESKNRLEDIRSIGATGVYDTNVLQRLAENADFVSTSLDTASSSYKEGTAAGEAYAKTTDTLLARLKELGNSLVELGVRAGAPLLAVLSPLISLVKFLVNSFADFPPVVLGALAAVTLFAGGYILLKGATATAIAAIIGFRFVLEQLSTTGAKAGLSMATLREQVRILSLEMRLGSGAAAAQAAALTGTGAAAQRSSLSMAAMGTAMKGIGWLVAISFASQLAEGLYENNKAAIQAANGFGIVANAAKGAKLSSDDIAKSFQNARDQLSGIDQVGTTNALASFVGDVLNFTDYTKQAKQEIAAIDDRLAKMVADGNGDAAGAQVDKLGLKFGDLAALLPEYKAALADAGEGTKRLGDLSNDAEENLTALDAAMKAAKESVEQLFGSLNQQSDFGGAIQDLFSGIYDSGNAFDYLDEVGRTNLSNLQAAIEQTVVYAEQSGVSTTNSLASLFANLAQQGVNTDAIFRALAASPYEFKGDIDLSAVQAKVQAFVSGGSVGSITGNKSQQALSLFNSQLSTLAVTAPKAENGLSGVGTAAKKTGSAAADAAKEVKTLNDYASDLNTVFSDASKYRFGVTDALDEIASSWQDIRDQMADQKKELADNRKQNAEALTEYKQKITDARVELRGFRSDIAGLQAQLSQKKYFLRIAVQYGDTLRSQALGADIADINSQIASKQNDVAKSQKEIKTPFEATTATVDNQKKSLGELYDAYQDAVVEYARSGLSQEELGKKTEALRQDFIKQATQAGYSKTQIDKYSGAFDDLTYAIKNVPRKITVTANTNPAVQALNDFLAKANKAKANPQIDSSGASAAGTRAAENFQSAFSRRMATISLVAQSVQDSVSKIKIPDLSGIRRTLEEIGKYGLATGGFVPGKNAFPTGGFVPGATPADRRRDNTFGTVAGGGIVALQGGEPIMTNAARSKYGDAMFDQINSLRFQPTMTSPTIVMQGGGAGYTELSPTDRALLQRISDRIGLTISTTALEQAVGAGNTASSRRRSG